MELTVTGIVIAHPPDDVYVIVAPPAETPVAMPAPDMDAIEVLLLLHVPPAVASLSGTEYPMHIDVLPVIAAGKGLTVITVVAKQPVGNV